MVSRMKYFFRHTRKDVAFRNRITITGNAKNIGGRPVVVSESTGIYYVEGLTEWEQDWLHQVVRMTGNLEYRDDKMNITTAVLMLL